jgi:hypothetical protein
MGPTVMMGSAYPKAQIYGKRRWREQLAGRGYRVGMTPHPTPWTMETVTAGLARFYHEIAGVGLVFPRESSLVDPPLPPQKAGPPLPSPLVAPKGDPSDYKSSIPGTRLGPNAR